ncbi:hypothetical protein QBC41DRAFT_19392 [Cercophora samala]|uniref:Uncharacterized protein n=1 Tax=Cercophora samala TaxID=330535 RepID=A0AA39ZK56_9PEZI|nr:hypothetical protein QBC41DRAFT_19392 [Cercophora samala]
MPSRRNIRTLPGIRGSARESQATLRVPGRKVACHGYRKIHRQYLRKMAKFHPRLARKRQKAFAAAAASAAAATSANPTTTKLLTQIAVAQINLKGSAKRIRKLRTCVEGLDTPWDVIAIQDPPREIAWANMPGYRVWYQTDRELSLQDRFPTSPLRQRSKRGSTQPATPEAIFMKVAFYIKDHIHESSWEAVPVSVLLSFKQSSEHR